MTSNRSIRNQLKATPNTRQQLRNPKNSRYSECPSSAIIVKKAHMILPGAKRINSRKIMLKGIIVG
jgi:hypothetical protein